MSDVKRAEQHQSNRGREVATRSREVKSGHLPVSELASSQIGASAPFGRSDFPMPLKDIYYEHPGPVPPRNLNEERH